MITVKHTDLSGNKLPDTKISKEQLLQGISSFGDSKQALAYIQQSFMNNIQTQELGLKGQSVALQKRSVENQEDSTQASKILGLQNLQVNKDRLAQTAAAGFKAVKDSATGEIKYVDPSKLKPDENGVLQLPKGLVPVNARTEPSDASVARLASDIMKDSTQNKKMVDGKRVPITPEEAGSKARAILRKQGGGDSNEDPTDRLIRLMKEAQAANAVDSE
jgi:hypothetical protein